MSAFFRCYRCPKEVAARNPSHCRRPHHPGNGIRCERHRPVPADLGLVLYGVTDQAVGNRLGTFFQESALPFSVAVINCAAIDAPLLRAHIDLKAFSLFVRTGSGPGPVGEPRTP